MIIPVDTQNFWVIRQGSSLVQCVLSRYKPFAPFPLSEILQQVLSQVTNMNLVYGLQNCSLLYLPFPLPPLSLFPTLCSQWMSAHLRMGVYSLLHLSHLVKSYNKYYQKLRIWTYYIAFKIALYSLSLCPPSLSSSLSVLNGWAPTCVWEFIYSEFLSGNLQPPSPWNESPSIVHAESAKRLKLWKRLLPFYFYFFFVHWPQNLQNGKASVALWVIHRWSRSAILFWVRLSYWNTSREG